MKDLAKELVAAVRVLKHPPRERMTDEIASYAGAEMRLVGHALADDAGRFLSVDAGFSEIMAAPIASLVKRTVLSITAPDDRALTGARFDRLKLDDTPHLFRKRYLRDDGSLAWVENHVALLRDGLGPPRMIATITQIEPPHTPSDLLHAAKLLLEGRRRRDRAFDAELFSDPAWDLLLGVYVCEAEGRILTAKALREASGVAASVAERWIQLLLASGLIEAESAARADLMSMPLRLSGEGHRRFEQYLGELVHWHDMTLNRLA
jgi:PAS domain S-box-containing protein